MAVYRDTAAATMPRPQADTAATRPGGAAAHTRFHTPPGNSPFDDPASLLANPQYAVGLLVLLVVLVLVNRGGAGRGGNREDGELEMRLAKKRVLGYAKKLQKERDGFIYSTKKLNGSAQVDAHTVVEQKLREAARLEARALYAKSVADKLSVVMSGLGLGGYAQDKRMPALVDACASGEVDKIAAALEGFELDVELLDPNPERVGVLYHRYLDDWCDDEEFERQLASMPRPGRPAPAVRPVRAGDTIRERMTKKD